jgi:hypothetical protein
MALDRRKRAFATVTGPASIDEPVKESRSRSSLRGLTKIEVESISLSTCASCNRVIEKPGAICTTCHRVLCDPCSQARCPICNRCVCDRDECSGVLAVKVCRSHSFLAYLKFAFTGRR